MISWQNQNTNWTRVKIELWINPGTRSICHDCDSTITKQEHRNSTTSSGEILMWRNQLQEKYNTKNLEERFQVTHVRAPRLIVRGSHVSVGSLNSGSLACAPRFGFSVCDQAFLLFLFLSTLLIRHIRTTSKLRKEAKYEIRREERRVAKRKNTENSYIVIAYHSFHSRNTNPCGNLLHELRRYKPER